MTVKESIDLTPTPAAYQQMLLLIVSKGKVNDQLWAAQELKRIQPAIERGSWTA